MSDTPRDRDKILLEYTERIARTGTWELDLNTNEIYWSDGVYSMVGDEPQSYKIDFQIGLNVIHPDDHDKALAEMNAAIVEGRDYNIKKRFLLKDGTIKQILSRGTVLKDDSGKPVKLIGVFQDISEHEELLDKLRANEHRYKALVENGADAIAILGGDGSPTYVSPSISNVLGYTEEEALNLNLFELIHPADRDAVISKMGEVMANPGVPISGATSRTRHKDGSWRWLEATITNLIDDPDIGGIVDNFRDVTDWRQMQSMLNTATSMSRVGSWELDRVDPDQPNIIWSPMIRDIMEVDEDYDPNPTGGIEFYVPQSQELLKDRFDELIQTGKTFDLELQIISGRGNSRWIRCIGESERDENDRCLRVYGSFQDIDRQKSIEEELRLSNERFEKVTQATNDAIWDFDVAGNQLQWGKGFLTQFGYDSDVINPNFDFLISKIHEQDRHRVVSRIQEYMHDPSKSNWFEEYQFEKSDGTFAYVIDRAIFIRDASGRVIRVVGAMTDISYRKDMEDSLRKLNQQLENHSRELALSNKELEQFAYVTSHDLQEPLRMINSFLVLLKKKYGDKLDPKAQQYIHFATDGALRMRQIILDLLEFSRVGVHLDRIESIDFNQVINEVKTLQRRKIDDLKAEVTFDNLPTIDTYKSPIIQIFHNLIGNALKYSDPSRPPQIHVTVEDQKAFYKFSVTDNGIGIEPEFHEKIFIIFQRLHTKERYSGTGMGLAIVKKIVENLGGEVGVNSVPNQGSTFYFTMSK
jgi:PAS domain S-box-containing protein